MTKYLIEIRPIKQKSIRAEAGNREEAIEKARELWKSNVEPVIIEVYIIDDSGLIVARSE